MQKILSATFLAVLLVVNAGRVNKKEDPDIAPPNESQDALDPYTLAENAFKTEGFSAEQTKKILDYLFSQKINPKTWPFTDYQKQVSMSLNNGANTNAGSVSEAISQAGGDPSDPSTITPEIQTAATEALNNGHSPPTSMLQKAGFVGAASTATVPASVEALGATAVSNFQTIEALTATLSMEAGQVATNSAALGKLSTAVATNAAWISSLGGEVANLHGVTAPMMTLSAELGIATSQLASMSLAGSFVGPMLGVIALVYAAWPEESVDPWLQAESRVHQMLSERFDKKRREKLGARQKRYVKQFSRCSQAWLAHNMETLHGVALPRWIVDKARMQKVEADNGGEFDMVNTFPEAPAYTLPSCMAQLEGHMSLERDEWYGTQKGTMSALFMPFANMHTQILSVLADNPMDHKMQWPATLKATSAEYGNFMLGHLKASWKSHVCRSMRLRHSMKSGVYWKYSFVVLRELKEPNAAEQCDTKCGNSTGWCDWCGGKYNGACCQAGDGGVCSRFDAPVGWHGSKYKSCVHVGCVQQNTGYYGDEKLKVIKEPLVTGIHTAAEQCQQVCQAVEGAVAFTSKGRDGSCVCLGKKGLTRHQEKGASSGPTKCKAEQMSIKEQEDVLAQKVEDLTKVPMEEIEPCEKSPAVSNFAEVEENHQEWVQTCMKKAAKVMTAEYNEFYLRFAKFVDTLAWKSGCGARHQSEWGAGAEGGEGFLAISREFDGGKFADCDWDKQKKEDDGMWMFDEERSRGWTGTSRVNMDEQKTVKMQYPMPGWLSDLSSMGGCMEQTAAGLAEDPSNGQSQAVGTIMDPVGSDSFNI